VPSTTRRSFPVSSTESKPPELLFSYSLLARQYAPGPRRRGCSYGYHPTTRKVQAHKFNALRISLCFFVISVTIICPSARAIFHQSCPDDQTQESDEDESSICLFAVSIQWKDVNFAFQCLEALFNFVAFG